MKKVVSLVLALIIAAGCFGLIGTASAMQEEKFVKTGNGKTLNVRNIQSGEVIGRLNYGDRVEVYDYVGEWAYIFWGNAGGAKVMNKFLSWDKPGKYVPQAPDGTTLTDSALGSETVEGMNKQYSAMKYVTEYTVVTVPATRTGTVNLRWGPSKNTRLVMKAPADYELTVLAQSSNWLMVRDNATGKICYIAKKYTNAQ